MERVKFICFAFISHKRYIHPKKKQKKTLMLQMTTCSLHIHQEGALQLLKVIIKINRLYLFFVILEFKWYKCLMFIRISSVYHKLCLVWDVLKASVPCHCWVCCRGRAGSSPGRFDLAQRVEQRFLHAHFCWRLSLPGETLLYAFIRPP